MNDPFDKTNDQLNWLENLQPFFDFNLHQSVSFVCNPLAQSCVPPLNYIAFPQITSYWIPCTYKYLCIWSKKANSLYIAASCSLAPEPARARQLIPGWFIVQSTRWLPPSTECALTSVKWPPSFQASPSDPATKSGISAQKLVIQSTGPGQPKKRPKKVKFDCVTGVYCITRRLLPWENPADGRTTRRNGAPVMLLCTSPAFQALPCWARFRTLTRVLVFRATLLCANIERRHLHNVFVLCSMLLSRSR